MRAHRQVRTLGRQISAWLMCQDVRQARYRVRGCSGVRIRAERERRCVGCWTRVAGRGVPVANARQGQVSSDDEAAVRAVEAAYDAAWNAGDLASLLGLLTDRVVIINPYGEMTIGRDAVETSFTALFDGAAKGSTHTSQLRAVHFVGPDVALVDAQAVISDFGQGPEPLRHDFTDVLVRTRAGWRIDQVRAYSFIPRTRG